MTAALDSNQIFLLLATTIIRPASRRTCRIPGLIEMELRVKIVQLQVGQERHSPRK
jgi:hypothetical protein